MARVEDVSAAEAPLEWDTPLFRTAQTQFEQAIPYADVNESIVERLRYPERALILTLPVKLDDHPGQRHHLCPGARHGWQLAREVPPSSAM